MLTSTVFSAVLVILASPVLAQESHSGPDSSLTHPLRPRARIPAINGPQGAPAALSPSSIPISETDGDGSDDGDDSNDIDEDDDSNDSGNDDAIIADVPTPRCPVFTTTAIHSVTRHFCPMVLRKRIVLPGYERTCELTKTVYPASVCTGSATSTVTSQCWCAACPYWGCQVVTASATAFVDSGEE